MKYTTDDIIKMARKVHGDKYEYGEYLGYNTKMRIVCPIHGEFFQTPHSHLHGHGCRKCFDERNSKNRQMDTNSFVKKAKEKYGDLYDYSMVEYVDSKTKIKIKCNKCGCVFEQRPAKHLNTNGCPECAKFNSSLRQRSNIVDFVEKARKIHGDKYDYSKFVYVNNKTNGIVICPEHGEFNINPNAHLAGNGCKVCGQERVKSKLKKSLEDFISDARAVFGDRYDYNHVVYVNHHTPVTVTCMKHGDFEVTPCNHLSNSSGCPKCGNIVSKWEKEIRTFIEDIGVNVIPSERKILNKKEIDIYAPDFRIGIECDGLLWHNEINKDKNFHFNKTKEAEKEGVRLIHIFEDEWKFKRPIVESMLRNIFGKNSRRIYARQCTLKEISPSEKSKFINENHIQGDTKSKVNLGLFLNGELVCVMTFGKPRVNLGHKAKEGQWELVRFCSKLGTSVVGGASKLLSYFKKKYSYDKIVSYCDKRWSIGNMYEKLGFVCDHESRPNYFYVIGLRRENRFKYRKDVLVREGFDKDKSEHEIMLERKIYRIYDCGTKVFVMENKG